MSTKRQCLVLFAACLMTVIDADAAPAGFNYDESKVPAYELPALLVCQDGTRVMSARDWQKKRRPELVDLFQSHVYGRLPQQRLKEVRSEVTSVDKAALGGLATRKEVTVHFTRGAEGPRMHLLIFTPNNAGKPVPAFLGLNFQGNHAVHPDPAITLSQSWMRSGGKGVVNNRATEEARGAASSRWPVEMILKRGYGLVTIYYGDIEPDHAEGWTNSVRSLFQPRSLAVRKPGAQPLGVTRGRGAPDEASAEDWGAIGAWAWGLSRALDYLEKDPQVDAKRVAVMGHSRLGKTSLWAGASDERFAMVISNDSGCGGAALSRRQFGETVARINTSFPHWFCGRFKDYNGRENTLPVDQHGLIALMAPRPVYVASALEDQWADPKGEFLSALHAGPLYELFGRRGVNVSEQPPVDHPVGEFVGYHVRTGGHDVKDYDWEQYLRFADRHLKRSR